MNFDIGAIQCKRLNAFYGNGLRLKCLFDLVKDSAGNPVAKPAINAIPIAEVGASKFGGSFNVKMGSLLPGAMPARFCGLIFATSGGAKPCVNWGGFANYHQTWMHPTLRCRIRRQFRYGESRSNRLMLASIDRLPRFSE